MQGDSVCVFLVKYLLNLLFEIMATSMSIE